jgi:hypothetical protein
MLLEIFIPKKDCRCYSSPGDSTHWPFVGFLKNNMQALCKQLVTFLRCQALIKAAKNGHEKVVAILKEHIARLKEQSSKKTRKRKKLDAHS